MTEDEWAGYRMTEAKWTEYRVRRFDPTRPSLDVTWYETPRASTAHAHAAQARHDYARGPHRHHQFIVEERTVTATYSEWTEHDKSAIPSRY